MSTKAEQSRKWRESNPEKVKEYAEKYKIEHAQQIKERRAKYYAEHAEKYREYARIWGKENKEAHNASCKRWRDSHKEQAREAVRKWEREHRDKVVSYSRKWQKDNLDQYLSSDRTRRALRKGCEGSHTAKDIHDQLQSQSGLCAYCNIPLEKYHVEHVIPLSREGSNYPDNLVLSCKTCNHEKGCKDVYEWLNNRVMTEEEEQYATKFED